MGTKQELARSFAAEIRGAVGHTKIAKSEAIARTPTLRPVIQGVLQKVESLVWEGTSTPISEADKAEVLALMDGVLGVRPGSMAMLKKGSVESLIAFDAAVQALLADLIS